MAPDAHEHVIAPRVQRDFTHDGLPFLRDDDLRGDRTVVEEPFESREPGLNLLTDERG